MKIRIEVSKQEGQPVIFARGGARRIAEMLVHACIDNPFMEKIIVLAHTKLQERKNFVTCIENTDYEKD